MDRAEAIRFLESIATNLTGEYVEARSDWVSEYIEREIKAIDMAIAALREQEQSKWISVKERLPEDDVDVLTRRATGMSVESHCGFGWIYDEYNGRWEVTHWMQLPEPPKEGAEG